MAVSVIKDSSEVYGFRFKFDIDDLGESYQCEADLQSNSLTVGDYQTYVKSK